MEDPMGKVAEVLHNEVAKLTTDKVFKNKLPKLLCQQCICSSCTERL